MVLISYASGHLLYVSAISTSILQAVWLQSNLKFSIQNERIFSEIFHWIKTGCLMLKRGECFSNFSCMFLNPNNFFQFEFIICYIGMRNLQEHVKKAFCYPQLFWPITVWINCSSDLKCFANSRPSASYIKKNSRSLEQFFLTVGQNNFGNKILIFIYLLMP